MVKFMIIHQNVAIEVTAMLKFMIIHQNVAVVHDHTSECCY